MTPFEAHLATGLTTVCRAWRVVRRDGAVFGFTDHDRDLGFEGVVFRAGTGLGAGALSQTTGLAVDNGEAVGALSDAAVTEADLLAGRFDAAEVTAWEVNWADPAQRRVQFRGRLGEIVRAGGAFRAELRGLTEGLNRLQGRTIQKDCGAILGDGACRFDLDQPGYSAQRAAESVEDGRLLRFATLAGFAPRWFEKGRLQVLSGAAQGALAVVKNDREADGGRLIELWEAIAGLAPGDQLRIDAGCDKRAETCRVKFANLANFRGFPHVPGEDWLTSYPARTRANDGGSLKR